MPYRSAVSITLSSRMEPPGCTMNSAPDRLARCTLSPKGKKASLPTVIPRWVAIQARFSSRVRTGGLTWKGLRQAPRESSSSYSSDR